MTELQKAKQKVADHIRRHNLGKRTNERDYVWSRYYLFAYMHYCLNMKQAEIARAFGGVLDRSSVYHGLKKHDDLMETKDPEYLKMTIREIKEFPLNDNYRIYAVQFNGDEQKKITEYMMENDLNTIPEAIKHWVSKINIGEVVYG